MILQRNILTDDTETQLYYRASGEVSVSKEVRVPEEVSGKGEKLCIADGTRISNDTYMNAFDIGAWKKYTGISNIYLTITISGKGCLKLIRETADGNKGEIGKLDFETVKAESETYQLIIPVNITDGILYFEIAAESHVTLYSAVYETDAMPTQKIKLSAVICTYHRRQQLEELLEVLKQTRGIGSQCETSSPWETDSQCETGSHCKNESQWLRIKVIDNASELENSYGNGIRVYHNPNTGGSGGFTRGMEETVNDLPEFPATHVLLMDDDIFLLPETISRLYSLLSYIKPEYQKEAVAGRMFRKDNPKVQYTAVEIWNQGNLRHIGWNCDMTVRDNLWSMNDNTGGEYGGWWFCCYPIEFVKNNRPLPFFLHCDDVEYGLRHGGMSIILNGIQVWHETYEYRKSPAITYYDMRNKLIVNAIYCREQTKEEVLLDWKRVISEFHVNKMFLYERMAIMGLMDFCRGAGYFQNIRTDRKHRCIRNKRQCRKIINSILWRIAEKTAVKKYETAVISYQNIYHTQGENYDKATEFNLSVNR